MALGTMTSISAKASVGPVFHDRVSQVGDGAYTSTGTTGLLAKLRALRGDQRAIISVTDYSVGANYCVYNPATDKLKVYVRTTGVELADGSDSGSTYLLHIVSE